MFWLSSAFSASLFWKENDLKWKFLSKSIKTEYLIAASSCLENLVLIGQYGISGQHNWDDFACFAKEDKKVFHKPFLFLIGMFSNDFYYS